MTWGFEPYGSFEHGFAARLQSLPCPQSHTGKGFSAKRRSPSPADCKPGLG